MERERSKLTRKKLTPEQRSINKRLKAMDTPQVGVISEADIFRTQRKGKQALGRRDFLIFSLLIVGGGVSSVVALKDPINDIFEGRVSTRYGTFVPIERESFSVEGLPKDLDYLFIDKAMRADEHKMSAYQLLSTTDFPSGLLSYIAEKQIEIVYADAPGLEDQRFRNAVFAHKMLLWADQMRVVKQRPVKSAFIADSKRKDFLTKLQGKDIEAFLGRTYQFDSRNYGWTEQVILGHYKDEYLKMAIDSGGGIDNFFKVISITLPPGFKDGDLLNPEKLNQIKADTTSVKGDPKLIADIKQRLGI